MVKGKGSQIYGYGRRFHLGDKHTMQHIDDVLLKKRSGILHFLNPIKNVFIS